MNEIIERFVRPKIEEHGHTVLMVAAAPPFAYTIGLYSQIGYEIILFGIGPDHAQPILNSIAASAKAGLEIPLDTIIPQECAENRMNQWVRAAVMFKQCDHPDLFETYAIQAKQWYGKDVPVRQLVFPDRFGKFPHQEGYSPVMAKMQPLLYTMH